MKKREILKQVNKITWQIVKSTAQSWKEAISKAWKMVKSQIKAALAVASAYFQITFTKTSTGEITTRTASNAKIKDNTLLFFSITDNGFRKAVINEIIDVTPVNVNFEIQ
jgi:hypothetical protein